MKKRYVHTALIALIIGVAVIGYGIMHGITYFLPLADSEFAEVTYTLVLILLGLGIPYWLLKLVLHKAHLRHSAEKELKLKDIL